MHDSIVERISSHLRLSGSLDTVSPASEDSVRSAEVRLGFTLPTLLRSIYLSVGNGGFGPGYGLIGVSGGRASNLGTLADTYEEVKRGAHYLGWEWNEGLLPFCEWGCNVFSCVDCKDDATPIFQSEECRVERKSYYLDDFFNMWLDGVSILDVEGNNSKNVKIINPFTRKTATVRGAQRKPK